MAQPTRQEILAAIDEIATRYGIDPAVMKKVIEGESGFNPAAVGDQGQSFGLAQLYMGGGLGNTYEQQTGSRPDNPDDWRQQLEFMAKQATQGGKGWEPWHASARLGIDPQAGLPGGPTTAAGATAPASRGRGGQPMPPAQVTAGQPKDSGLLAALKDLQKPKETTLGGALLAKAGLIDPKDPNKPETLGGLVFQGLGFGKSEKDAAAEAAVKGYNEFAPMGRQAQIDALAKKKQPPQPTKTLGQGLWSLFS